MFYIFQAGPCDSVVQLHLKLRTRLGGYSELVERQLGGRRKLARTHAEQSELLTSNTRNAPHSTQRWTLVPFVESM